MIRVWRRSCGPRARLHLLTASGNTKLARGPTARLCHVVSSNNGLLLRHEFSDRSEDAIKKHKRTIQCPRRKLSSLSAIPAPILVPLIFTGLLLALWTYKCLMMILFQNKIIYMPSMPPFSRSERIADYAHACYPTVWREERIRSEDGTKIALAVGEAPHKDRETKGEGKEVVIVYFQGNGGSVPPRTPDLSRFLKALQGRASLFRIVALSYRGYWTSKGSASERGIKMDAAAALAWVRQMYPKALIVLWGQSIGAGVATSTAADSSSLAFRSKIVGMILETPFTSVRDMLTAMYPQKWLPYRYLYPFLWSHWDSRQALAQLSQHDPKPEILIVAGERDEVVPSDHASELEATCRAGDVPVKRVTVPAALHHDAAIKSQGQRAVVDFLIHLDLSS